MQFRDYDPQKDKDTVRRILHEVGWVPEGKDEVCDMVFHSSRALVAEVNGAAECSVTATPATVRYLDEQLPMSAVTGVATSRVVRRQGIAKRLTARTIALEAAAGALVSALGIFEQGYYDQLGFGTGGYEHWVAFDPLALETGVKPRVPLRLTPDDWGRVHANRLNRAAGHGACNLLPAEFTKWQMLMSEHGFGFGFGYGDGPNGALTHHVWCNTRSMEYGPYMVLWIAYQTGDQFRELMALLQSMGDQVRLIRMREPRDIQLQDLIKRPLRQSRVSQQSQFETGIRAVAYWQMRMNDITACLARTHLRGSEVRFNLQLSDPIERYLDESTPWRGVGGNYVVTLGPSSGAEIGTDATLPTLTASVGAFTRLWLGVRPATGLSVTTDLHGPRALLEELDWLLRLPEAKPEWEF